jgi:putative membrane protein
MRLTWWKSGTLAVAMTLVAGGAYAQGPSRDEVRPNEAKAASQQQTAQQDKKEFAQNMFMANLAEVQLGQLGVQHATSPEVKSFAQMMVTEHTKANQELVPIAQQLGVERPTELDAKHKAIVDRLSKLQGAEFDKAFMDTMVSAHNEAAAQLGPLAGHDSAADAGGSADTGNAGITPGGSSASGSSATAGQPSSQATVGTTGTTGATGTTGTAGATVSTPTTVEQYAAKTLASVHQHLEHAKQLQDALDK